MYEWTCVSEDQKKAVGMVLQVLVEPNSCFEQYAPKGLDADAKYRFYNRQLQFNLKSFGGLINYVSPVHIKLNSLLHDAAAKVVKMPGEVEEHVASGKLLMEGKVKLKQAFAATGYADDMRFYQDFASRMYFMEKCD